MDDGATDGQVIWRSLKDPGRFGLIFDRHFDTVHRYLRRRVGDEAAQELASDVFVEAFEHRSRYDCARADALPWLLGIATNLVRHHFRQEHTRFRAYARAAARAEVHDYETADDRLDAERMMSRLLEIVSALDVRDRDVLLLYAWTGLSYEQIAEGLSVPIGTVRSRLHRARRRIRELISQDPAIQDESTRAADR